MQEFAFIFQIVILIMSIVIHEVSHGYVAEALGDPTARLQGRLTLNPIPHIDPFGSIILPAISLFFGGFIIGWAKPVPYNPYNLKKGKWGPVLVAIAGPAANILLAVIFSIIIRLNGVYFTLGEGTLLITQFIVLINLILAFFNLIPIPPLDGSKIISGIIPYRLYPAWQRFEMQMRGIGIFVIFIAIYLLSVPFFNFVRLLFFFFTGTPT